MKAKKKYGELWSKIRDLIRSIIAKNSDDYNEKYMKTKFDSDDILPLTKAIEIPIMTIVVRAVSYENNKYYPQVFLVFLELTCLKELILIKQAHQKSVIFDTTGIS